MDNHKPKKRSLTLDGHKTSVSIEDPFWIYFTKLATQKNLSLNQLAAEIDRKRDPNVGLATSIRIFCLTEALRL